MRMITSIDIMHPEDRKALQILMAIACIDTICRKLMNIGYERIFRGEKLSNMVRCSENCMPKFFELMSNVATK